MKYSKLFVALLVMVFICGIAFASVGVKEEGTMLGAATDLNFVGVGITATGDYGTKTITSATPVVESDTYKTLTVAESGTTFVATGVTTVGTASRTFRLPDITSANDGVFFVFANGQSTTDKPTADESAPELNIDPGEHSTIFLTGASEDATSIRAQIGADSYPSIKLVAFGGDWFVQSTGECGSGRWTAGS